MTDKIKNALIKGGSKAFENAVKRIIPEVKLIQKRLKEQVDDGKESNQ